MFIVNESKQGFGRDARPSVTQTDERKNRGVSMKIKEIHLDKFKRFTDLTIKGIPQTAKLIVSVGPNGCGKSSLFDAFKTWHLLKGYGNGADNDYCKKDISDQRQSYQLVSIEFYNNIEKWSHEDFRHTFYFRTAYRNSPEITVKSYNEISSPIDRIEPKMMIHNDDTVNDNYQRFVSRIFSNLFSPFNDEMTVKDLRYDLLSKIREPLKRLFPDLLLTEIGFVTNKAEFYFSKGCADRYGYKNLSGGEKAVFDLILDLVIKSEYYQDTVFCIDEPELHIHTSLQARILRELFALVPNQSQLWIATHSFGMLKEARKLKEQYPEEVVFLNFDGYDFDDTVTIEPSECDTVLWNKLLEITLDEYSSYMIPETIVFCEGTTQGKKRKEFDARCFTTIFRSTHPGTMFYSLGSCSEIENKTAIMDFIKKLSPSSNIIRVIDRDDRSEEEIDDLTADGIKVLTRRHLESYLLDDEVLKKWCCSVGQADKVTELLQIKKKAMEESHKRGNPEDDVKSASNDICTRGKKLLGLTKCGNNGDMIMRDTLAKLITPDMKVYQSLESEIF